MIFKYTESSKNCLTDLATGYKKLQYMYSLKSLTQTCSDVRKIFEDALKQVVSTTHALLSPDYDNNCITKEDEKIINVLYFHCLISVLEDIEFIIKKNDKIDAKDMEDTDNKKKREIWRIAYKDTVSVGSNSVKRIEECDYKWYDFIGSFLCFTETQGTNVWLSKFEGEFSLDTIKSMYKPRDTESKDSSFQAINLFKDLDSIERTQKLQKKDNSKSNCVQLSRSYNKLINNYHNLDINVYAGSFSTDYCEQLLYMKKKQSYFGFWLIKEYFYNIFNGKETELRNLDKELLLKLLQCPVSALFGNVLFLSLPESYEETHAILEILTHFEIPVLERWYLSVLLINEGNLDLNSSFTVENCKILIAKLKRELISKKDEIATIIGHHEIKKDKIKNRRNSDNEKKDLCFIINSLLNTKRDEQIYYHGADLFFLHECSYLIMRTDLTSKCPRSRNITNLMYNKFQLLGWDSYKDDVFFIKYPFQTLYYFLHNEFDKKIVPVFPKPESLCENKIVHIFKTTLSSDKLIYQMNLKTMNSCLDCFLEVIYHEEERLIKQQNSFRTQEIDNKEKIPNNDLSKIIENKRKEINSNLMDVNQVDYNLNYAYFRENPKDLQLYDDMMASIQSFKVKVPMILIDVGTETNLDGLPSYIDRITEYSFLSSNIRIDDIKNVYSWVKDKEANGIIFSNINGERVILLFNVNRANLDKVT